MTGGMLITRAGSEHEGKVSVNDAARSSKFRDLIHFKTLFFFSFSFCCLSDAAAISTSIVFIAESRERGNAEGEIRLQDTVQHYLVGGSSHLAARGKNTINQPNDPSCSRFANVYATNECTFIKQPLFEQLSFVILICRIASVAPQHQEVALVAPVDDCTVNAPKRPREGL